MHTSSSASRDVSRLPSPKIVALRPIDGMADGNWPPQGRSAPLQPSHVLGKLVFLSSMAFVMFPQIDLGVSRLFTDGTQFYLSDNRLLVLIRDANRMLPYLVVPVMIVLMVARPVRRSAPLMSKRALFVLLTYALGSALMVHAFKFFFGRARPQHVIEFGGAMEFTPAWQFASMCKSSCSFPSGEAASAAAFIAVLVFVPDAYRKYAAAVIVPLSIIVALNRVVMGAHFLSDAVLGWLLVCWLMFWLHGRMGLKTGV